ASPASRGKQQLFLPLRSGGRCRRRKGEALDLALILAPESPRQERPLQSQSLRDSFPRSRGKQQLFPLRSGGRCRLQAQERLRTAKLARRASAMDGASHADGGRLLILILDGRWVHQPHVTGS